MLWRSYPCQCCSGQKNIEIGNEYTNEYIEMEVCPICLGKGYLNVPHHDYTEDDQIFWKRMMGDGGLV